MHALKRLAWAVCLCLATCEAEPLFALCCQYATHCSDTSSAPPCTSTGGTPMGGFCDTASGLCTAGGRYFCHESGSVQLQGNGDLIPGAIRSFAPLLPAQMLLEKDLVQAFVELNAASLTVTFNSFVDPNGRSGFSLLSGSGSFKPYVFGSDSFGQSQFVMNSGEGSIHWGSGVVTMRSRITVALAGFPNLEVLAKGSGVADFATDRISLDPQSIAYEIDVTGGATGVRCMPALGRYLFAAPLILMTLVIVWRRRFRTS
jgi:hypothetical protein